MKLSNFIPTFIIAAASGLSVASSMSLRLTIMNVKRSSRHFLSSSSAASQAASADDGQASLLSYFPSKKAKTTPQAAAATSSSSFCTSTKPQQSTDPKAEALAKRLDTTPVYLTSSSSSSSSSWYILKKGWIRTKSPEAFDVEWNLHPSQRHVLKVYGRTVQEKRWSQMWGDDLSYRYSGAIQHGRPILESTMVGTLLEKVNLLTEGLYDVSYQGAKDTSQQRPSFRLYNACLQNWYEPDDTIGLHADDEKDMIATVPIFSLSWGGTRRFLLRPKKVNQNSVSSSSDHQYRDNTMKVHELWLQDGDLLIMGGTCQQTHKHEIPKVRKAKDPSTSQRINWTLRAFLKRQTNKNKQEKV